VLNDQRLRAASDAVRTASESSQGKGQDARVTELQANLAELGQLRGRMSVPTG